MTNVKKYKWIAAASSVAIVIIFAIILGIALNVVINKYENASSEMLSSYAARLDNVGIDTVKNMTSSGGNSLMYKDLIDPRIDVILYEKRPDNKAKYSTTSDFFNRNKVSLTGKLNIASVKTVADIDYMTYEFAMGDNYYVMLAMPFLEKDKYYVDYAISLAVFVLIVTAITVIMVLIVDKVVFSNVKKQREFINDMSHEIRTPLTVIKGNLENMLAVPNCSVMEVSDSIETSLQEVDHLTQLSQNLLSIVSDNRSKVVKKMSYQLSDTISSVLEVYSDIISGSGKTLIASIDSVNASVDVEKIKELLIILIDNAVKYTREGDKIKVQLKRGESGFELVVADTGIGIADGDEDKIFDRFYRGNNALSENGTGLGLSIAKSIVENHGGKIGATHNIPSGLVISVYIPSKQ